MVSNGRRPDLGAKALGFGVVPAVVDHRHTMALAFGLVVSIGVTGIILVEHADGFVVKNHIGEKPRWCALLDRQVCLVNRRKVGKF